MAAPGTFSLVDLHKAFEKAIAALKAIEPQTQAIKKLIEILTNALKMTECGSSMEFDISGTVLKVIEKK